ncbi:MAG: hypothetical protein RLZZ546_2875, partial [Bacteroidota bacterium]
MNNRNKSENLSKIINSEKSMLNAWKNEAAESLEALSDLKDVEKYSSQLKNYKSYDSAAAYEKIVGEKYNEEKSNIISFPNLKKLAIAASLIFLIGYFSIKIKHDQPLIYAADQSNREIILPDQSSVALDKESTISYIGERKVRLDGSAFFNIESTVDKKNFTIEVGNGLVTVLGTQFYVT